MGSLLEIKRNTFADRRPHELSMSNLKANRIYILQNGFNKSVLWAIPRRNIAEGKLKMLWKQISNDIMDLTLEHYM